MAGALEARSNTAAATAEPDNHPLPVGDLDQEVGVVSEPQVADQSSSEQWWYFDTASNAHVTGDRANYISFKEDTHGSQSIRGVTRVWLLGFLEWERWRWLRKWTELKW